MRSVPMMCAETIFHTSMDSKSWLDKIRTQSCKPEATFGLHAGRLFGAGAEELLAGWLGIGGGTHFALFWSGVCAILWDLPCSIKFLYVPIKFLCVPGRHFTLGFWGSPCPHPPAPPLERPLRHPVGSALFH